MFEYIYPLSKFIPSEEFINPLKNSFSDIVATSSGEESYAAVTPGITSYTSAYKDGASESDVMNVYVLFENEKSDSELTSIKSIIDTAISSFDPSDAKYHGAWDHLIT